MPRFAGLEPRARLFQRLDDLRQEHAAPWIVAPAGSGKTALVASYLGERAITALWYRVDEGDRAATELFYFMRRAAPASAKLPQYAPTMELAAYARRFFEALFETMPDGSVLVFDDFHVAPEDAPWQLAFGNALDSIRDGTNILVASRRPPPGVHTRARVHRTIGLLDAGELRFTEAETLALAKRRSGGRRVDAHRIHDASGGWAAGVSLLLQVGSRETPKGTEAILFDYLASTVFAELPEPIQRMLCSLACLPRFTPGDASALSGSADAAADLRTLHRNGMFLEAEPGGDEMYRFHELFRAFLAHRAGQLFDGDTLRALRARAASLLRADGRDEDAFPLLVENGELDGAIAVVRAHAQELLATGRTALLERWLTALPPDAIASDGWLGYWRASCALLGAPAESYTGFERALERFIATRDGDGAYLSWAAAVHALTYECRTWRGLASWFERLGEIEVFCPHFSSPVIGTQVATAVILGLTLIGADPELLETWAAKAIALSDNARDPMVRVLTASVLILHYALHGDAGRAGALVARLEHAPGPAGHVARIAAKGATVAVSVFDGDAAGGLVAALEGGALVGTAAVPMWSSVLMVFGAICALEVGDTAALDEVLERMRAIAEAGTEFERASLQAVSGMAALARGDHRAAYAAIQLSHDGVAALGFAYGAACSAMILAYIAYELGRTEQALEHLAALKRIEEQHHDRTVAYMRLVLEADRACETGDRATLGDRLRRAFAIAREAQLYYCSPSPPRDRMARLCAHAIEHGIEADYARALVRRRRLPAHASARGLASWPWPIRIRTLGELTIAVDDRELELGRSKMPLRVLQTIVALGSGGGEIALERIAAMLWPDSDGDSGMRTLEVTLVRLRKALGRGRDAIVVEGGKISLDPAVCWTDADALEALIAKRGAPRRILELYRGPFAGDDDDLPPELIGYRDQLRRRVSRAIPSTDADLQLQLQRVDPGCGAL